MPIPGSLGVDFLVFLLSVDSKQPYVPILRLILAFLVLFVFPIYPLNFVLHHQVQLYRNSSLKTFGPSHFRSALVRN